MQKNKVVLRFIVGILVFLIPVLVLAVKTTQKNPWGQTWVGYEMDWGVAEKYFDRVMGGHEWDFHGGIDIGPAGGYEDFGRLETRGGKRCLVGYYFLFDVADDYAFDIDEDLTVEVLFDRTVTDGYIFTFDGVGAPETFENELSSEYENRWHWETIKLKRARFTNRRENATDFGIASRQANLYHNHGNPTVAICDIRINRDAGAVPTPKVGTVEFKIRDALGKPTAARMGIYDETGKQPIPSDDAVIVTVIGMDTRSLNLINHQELDIWPGKSNYVFYAEDTYRAKLPAGEYQVVLYKGPEYRIIERKIEVRAGRRTRHTFQFERWVDMPARNWYSGDTHIHITRMDDDDDERYMSLIKAEDVHIAHNLTSISGYGNPQVYPNRSYGKDGVYRSGEYIIVSGQESPDTAELGHIVGLNVKSFHVSPDYNVYKDVADAVHADDGLYGYAHISIYPMLNPQRGLALDVGLGIVDFLELLQFGTFGAGLRLYYDFLNMGFKLLPSAGTDFPFANLPGTERQYVNVPGEFTEQAWMENFKKGHTFITTGPMLNMDVNGVMMGDEINIKSGEAITVRATASVNPDIDEIATIELIVQGEVVKVVHANKGAESLMLEHTFRPSDSLWLAVRTYGKGKGIGTASLSQQGAAAVTGTEAHSAPVYVYVDGNKDFSKKDMLRELAKFYKAEVLAIGFQPIDYNLNEARLDYSKEHFEAEWNRQLPRILELIEQAVETYDGILLRLTE